MSQTLRLNEEVKALEKAYILETDDAERARIERIINRTIAKFIFSFSHDRRGYGSLLMIEEDEVERRRMRF